MRVLLRNAIAGDSKMKVDRLSKESGGPAKADGSWTTWPIARSTLTADHYILVGDD